MTENQEKEMFGLLTTLVSEVRDIKVEVHTIKQTQDEHSRILNEHSKVLNEHSRILNDHTQILNDHSKVLNKHSEILNDHSKTLNLVVSKVDDVAATFILNDKWLTNLEKDVEDLRGEVH